MLAVPLGFFPDYLRAIWRIIGHRYGASVSLSFRFYPSVEAAQAAVIRGEADMTDIYFLLSHRNQVIRNPLSALYMTCPVIGAALLVYTRENEAETFEGLIQALTKAFMNKGRRSNFSTSLLLLSLILILSACLLSCLSRPVFDAVSPSMLLYLSPMPLPIYYPSAVSILLVSSRPCRFYPRLPLSPYISLLP